MYFPDRESSLFHGRGVNAYVVESRLTYISQDSAIDMRLLSVGPQGLFLACRYPAASSYFFLNASFKTFGSRTPAFADC